MAENEIKRVITIESSESLNTLNNLNARIKELKESMGDLDITTEEYRQVSEEVTQLENVKRNAIRGVTAAVEGSYNAYSKELSILQKHRKTLNENTQEYKDMTKRVAELQQKLKDMDADVGVYSRNVGNYSSAFDGLQGAVDNAAKKLPQLSSGVAGFAAEMVEDIPKIIAQLQAMTAAENGASAASETMAATGELAGVANTTVATTATAAAAGETAMGVAAEGAAVGVSTLVKACTSWNVILLALITVLQIFADDIQAWIEGLAESESSIKKVTSSVSLLQDELEENGYGIGETIVKVKSLQYAWNELGDNLNEKEIFLRENKSALDELGVSLQNINDAEQFFNNHTDDYIQSMMLRAKASAGRNLAAEQYEEMLKLENDRLKWDALIKSTEQMASVFPGGIESYFNAVGNSEKAREDYENAKKELAKVESKMAEFEKRAQRLITGALVNENKADSIYKLATPTSTPTTPTATTNTKPMLKDDLIALTGGAIDASAEREALKATLEARTQMTTANAEERKAIEEQLAKDLAEIESARLELHVVNLEAMLESDMLTNEERLTIEAELLQAKIDLNEIELGERIKTDEALLESEKERLRKEKEEKDKAAKEDKVREQNVQKFKDSMAKAASNIMRSTAELMEENSKEQKALNAASIVMDTFTSAMSGWKSGMALPMPLGPIVAAANVAASVAMGAAQLKNLMKTSPDGSNVEGALASAQSAPSVASSMPANYTRTLQGDNELTELNKETRVYVVESDITNAQKSARVRVESASF